MNLNQNLGQTVGMERWFGLNLDQDLGQKLIPLLEMALQKSNFHVSTSFNPCGCDILYFCIKFVEK